MLWPDDGLGAGPPPADAFERIDALAATAPIGSGSVIFTPWLNGERTPVDDRTLRASWINQSLATTRADQVRAVLEGVAYNTKWLLGAVEKFVDRRLDPIRVIGGGARSELWRQIHADVLERTIELVDDPQSANVRGAGFLGLVGLGRATFADLGRSVSIGAVPAPIPTATAIYRPLAREFKAYLPPHEVDQRPAERLTEPVSRPEYRPVGLGVPMCGIVAVVRRPTDRTPPSLSELAAELRRATGAPRGRVREPTPPAGPLDEASAHVEAVDAALRGVPGVRALIDDPAGVGRAAPRELETQQDLLDRLEARLDADGAVDPDELETVNAAMVRAKDAVWAVARDRLRAGREVEALAAGTAAPAAIEAFTSVQVALSAIDRLEVRGRDSAGLHLYVRDHGLDLDERGERRGAARRARPIRCSVRARCARPDGALSFVYKAAAEIGELGDNVAVAAPRDHQRPAPAPGARQRDGARRRARSHALGERRDHLGGERAPVEPGGGRRARTARARTSPPRSTATSTTSPSSSRSTSLAIPPEITTDAKVIPALVRRRIDAGEEVTESFRATVAAFEGSVAIGAHAAAEPDRVMLALRGSGQALYVGVADDCFVVASEPYGLVEETSKYLRLDGETPGNPEQPRGEPGPDRRARRERGRHRRGHRAHLLRRHGAPGGRRRARHAADHDP